MTHPVDLEQLLDKLRAAQDAPDFTADERKTVRNMINAYTTLLSWGKLGRILIWVVLTLSAVKYGFENLIGWPK
jgi:hypothetical protein